MKKEIKEYIIEYFSDEKIEINKKVGKYRISIYFSDYKFIVESEKDYNEERYNYLVETLDCTIVKYDEQDEEEDIYDIIRENIQSKKRHFTMLKFIENEKVIISNIMRAFKGLNICTNFILDDDYEVNLYFPKYALIVDSHSMYRYSDNKTEKKNKNQESRKFEEKHGMTFITYDSLDDNFNVFDLINQIMTHICNQTSYEK
jgi:hypothetical protein